jgi:hypothetical protein
MRAACKQLRAMHALLAVTCCVIGLALVRSVTEDVVDPVGRPPSTATDAERVHLGRAEPLLFTMPALDSYADFRDRPLFVKTRKAPEPEKLQAAPPPPAAKLPAVEVVGLMLSRDSAVALLRTGTDPKVLSVSQGSQVGGWSVDSISADRIILSNGQQKQEVLLHRPRDAKAAVK